MLTDEEMEYRDDAISDRLYKKRKEYHKSLGMPDFMDFDDDNEEYFVREDYIITFETDTEEPISIGAYFENEVCGKEWFQYIGDCVTYGCVISSFEIIKDYIATNGKKILLKGRK